MKKAIVMPVAGLVLAGLSVTATAEDLEGRIEAIDAASQTFTVQGVTFQATDQTDYDDGLRQFSDLKVDQRVEVDFQYRDGQHIATEVERDEERR
ncbi:MAG: DUF5666 domain-containing protein [Pseudomonadales bacterium]|nr:DUF5666 domain-containing protein [Pseudomonadales bacterium]